MESEELERIFGRCEASILKAWSAICNQDDYQKAAESIWPDNIPPQLVSCLSDLERTSANHAWQAFITPAAIVFKARRDGVFTEDSGIFFAYQGIVDAYRRIWEHCHPWSEFDLEDLELQAWRKRTA